MLFVTLVATPFVLAGLILFTLYRWLQGGRAWLVATDVLATVLSLSLLPIFVFATNLPLVTLVLAPVATILAAVAPTKRELG